MGIGLWGTENEVMLFRRAKNRTLVYCATTSEL